MSIIFPAMSSKFFASAYKAASFAISSIEEPEDVITGMLHFMASKTGTPNPSNNDGYTNAYADPVIFTRSSSLKYPSIITSSLNLYFFKFWMNESYFQARRPASTSFMLLFSLFLKIEKAFSKFTRFFLGWTAPIYKKYSARSVYFSFVASAISIVTGLKISLAELYTTFIFSGSVL